MDQQARIEKIEKMTKEFEEYGYRGHLGMNELQALMGLQFMEDTLFVHAFVLMGRDDDPSVQKINARRIDYAEKMRELDKQIYGE